MTIIFKFIVVNISIFLTAASCSDILRNISITNDKFNNRNIHSVRENSRKLQNKHSLYYNEVMKNLTRINNVITDLINSYKEIDNNQETADYDSCEKDEGSIDNSIERVTKSDHKATEVQVTTSMYLEKHNNNENEQDDDNKDHTEVNDRVDYSSSDNKTNEKLTGFISDETDVSDVDEDENEKSNSEENESKLTEKGSTKITESMPAQMPDTKIKYAPRKEEQKITTLEKEKHKPHNVKKQKHNVERQKAESTEENGSLLMKNYDECDSTDKSEDPGVNAIPKKIQDIKQGHQKINRKIDTIFDFNGNMTIHTVDEEIIQGSEQARTDDDQIIPWYRNTGHPHKTNFKERRDKMVKAKNDSVESIDDKKALTKVQALRKDYGDACLKVVVKKCYKACKQVSKEMSKIYKSNEVFTEVFLSNSRRTCIKEFSGNMYARQGGLFPDITKDEYLAAACLPIETLAQRLRRLNQTATDPERKLNILRDGYEKECQKISAAKCTNACSNAGNITCETEKCDKKKLSKLKKECKRYCQLSYQDRKKIVEKKVSDSSEEDSDDTSSDSGSDSNSDSDDSDSDDSDSTIDVKDNVKKKGNKPINKPKRYKIKGKSKNRAVRDKDLYNDETDLKHLRLTDEDNNRLVNNRLNKSKIQKTTANSKQKYSREINDKEEQGKKLRYKVKVRKAEPKTDKIKSNHGTERITEFINKLDRKTKHKLTDRKEKEKNHKFKDIKEITNKHTDKNSKLGTEKHKHDYSKEETEKLRDYDTEETKYHKVYQTKQGTHEYENGSSDEITSTTRERRTKNADYESNKRTTKYEENNKDGGASMTIMTAYFPKHKSRF